MARSYAATNRSRGTRPRTGDVAPHKDEVPPCGVFAALPSSHLCYKCRCAFSCQLLGHGSETAQIDPRPNIEGRLQYFDFVPERREGVADVVEGVSARGGRVCYRESCRHR